MANVETSKYEYLEHETKFENFVSLYFRITLFLSAACMFVGFFMYVLYPTPFNFSDLQSKPGVIFTEMSSFTSVGIMFIGVAILLLIPLGRVVILILHYLDNKDFKMGVIAILVFIFMLIGILFNLG